MTDLERIVLEWYESHEAIGNIVRASLTGEKKLHITVKMIERRTAATDALMHAAEALKKGQ